MESRLKEQYETQFFKNLQSLTEQRQLFLYRKFETKYHTD